MRFMIACLAAALTGAALMGTPVRAQEPQAAAASARQLELTRRYIDLTMTDQFEAAIRQVIIDQATTDPAVRDIPEEDRRFLIELTAELTTDMIPRMLDEMVPIYARTFSEQELEALIAFYDTEMGRSIITKGMAVMPEATRAAMTVVVPQLMDKMATRMCQHYGCTSDELREMREEMRAAVTGASAPRTK